MPHLNKYKIQSECILDYKRTKQQSDKSYKRIEKLLEKNEKLEAVNNYQRLLIESNRSWINYEKATFELIDELSQVHPGKTNIPLYITMNLVVQERRDELERIYQMILHKLKTKG